MKHTVIRYHDFCAGHRVVGHESKCRHLHGHNYRVHFHVRVKELTSYGMVPDQLDSVGRVIDFSVVKEKLCDWLENNWDHKFLHWDEDTLIEMLMVGSERECAKHSDFDAEEIAFANSLVPVPFNPTAENMAQHLLEVVGPAQLADTDVELFKVVIEETRKCSVEAEL